MKYINYSWPHLIINYKLSIKHNIMFLNNIKLFLQIGACDSEPLILVLYVDDLFLTGNEKLITWCKKQLASKFEMKDLGLMHYFLES